MVNGSIHHEHEAGSCRKSAKRLRFRDELASLLLIGVQTSSDFEKDGSKLRSDIYNRETEDWP